jgi:hypothetical protein
MPKRRFVAGDSFFWQTLPAWIGKWNITGGVYEWVVVEI